MATTRRVAEAPRIEHVNADDLIFGLTKGKIDALVCGFIKIAAVHPEKCTESEIDEFFEKVVLILSAAYRDALMKRSAALSRKKVLRQPGWIAALHGPYEPPV
jgi:hypothetical protein